MNSHNLLDLNWPDWLLIFFSLVYLIQIFRFYRGLFHFKAGQNSAELAVTVIVPARNEAANIANCLNSLVNQSYSDYEIIVVDDHSTDETATIVQRIAEIHQQIKLLKLSNLKPCASPKKRAITRAITASRNEIIVTIDADCEAPSRWLETLMTAFEPTVGMAAGPVLFHQENNLFQKFQALEFLGLVTAGAGSLGAGNPIIANGANLAYRRVAFEAVNGFEGIDHLTSGDDDLLMQKIAHNTDWEVRFVPVQEAIVRTRPVKTVRHFLAQRTRWASKATIYDGLPTQFFLVVTYLFYGMLLAGIPLVLLDQLSPEIFLPILALKLGVDWLVVRQGCRLFDRSDLLKYFFLAEFLQIPYILYVGAMGTFGKIKWKDQASHKNRKN